MGALTPRALFYAGKRGLGGSESVIVGFVAAMSVPMLPPLRRGF
jgi:hypothetical protein